MADPKNRLSWNVTVKPDPAIGDLQAISGFFRFQARVDNVGAPNYNHDLYTVPAGKMFMLNFIQGMCYQSTPTAIEFMLVTGGTEYGYYYSGYGGAYEIHRSFENVLYDEDEIVRVRWSGTLAATDVNGWTFGYLMDKY